MIFGIGIDLVKSDRVKLLIDRFQDRFVRKILTNNEFELYLSSSKKVAFVANRFAAKEAFVKSLGTGFRYPVTLKAISILHDTQGKPFFVFNRDLQILLNQFKIINHHLTITDEKKYACAFVVLEK